MTGITGKRISDEIGKTPQYVSQSHKKGLLNKKNGFYPLDDIMNINFLMQYGVNIVNLIEKIEAKKSGEEINNVELDEIGDITLKELTLNTDKILNKASHKNLMDIYFSLKCMLKDFTAIENNKSDNKISAKDFQNASRLAPRFMECDIKSFVYAAMQEINLFNDPPSKEWLIKQIKKLLLVKRS